MNRPVLFQNAVLLHPEAAAGVRGSLLAEGERILGCLKEGECGPPETERIDLGGAFLAPGLLDVHFHGSLVFSADEQVESALIEASALLARHGVTGFLATTIALESRELRRHVTRLARALTRSDWPGAHPLGIHLEGPWIRREAAGAQPLRAIRPYEAAEGNEVLDRGEGWVRMVTLAPDIPGAGALLEELVRRGQVAALGHTLASAGEVREAVDRGARHVTHLFNAMGSLHQREPGLAGAALAEERLSCDVICDGIHVHPDWVRVAARVKGEGLLLISDGILPPREADSRGFGSGQLRDDGVSLRLPDGRLAGSRLRLDQALRNAQDWGALGMEEAVAACSVRPARLLGMELERGTLRPGARADLVVLDSGGGVRETWVGGRRVHPRARP